MIKIPPYKTFGGASDEAWFWLNTEGRKVCPGLHEYLPSMPGDRIQTLSAGRGDEGLKRGFDLYKEFLRLYSENGGTFSDSTTVLDFGCGWGRIIRFFLREAAGERIFGTDISKEGIDACTETNKWCEFRVNNSHPPTEFEDQQFDLIYAFSVFSHLPEDLHLQWVQELNRILKPGGVFISTTLRRDFITTCSPWHENSQVDKWQRNAGRAFSDTEEWLSRYDQGDFCFGMVGENQPFYGFSCIPEAYLQRYWTKIFNSVTCLPDKDWTGQQVIVSLRKAS